MKYRSSYHRSDRLKSSRGSLPWGVQRGRLRSNRALRSRGELDLRPAHLRRSFGTGQGGSNIFEGLQTHWFSYPNIRKHAESLWRRPVLSQVSCPNPESIPTGYRQVQERSLARFLDRLFGCLQETGDWVCSDGYFGQAFANLFASLAMRLAGNAPCFAWETLAYCRRGFKLFFRRDLRPSFLVALPWCRVKDLGQQVIIQKGAELACQPAAMT